MSNIVQLAEAEMKRNFPIGSKVRVLDLVGNWLDKKLLNQIGVVVSIAGKFIVTEFESKKELQYLYYSHLERVRE